VARSATAAATAAVVRLALVAAAVGVGLSTFGAQETAALPATSPSALVAQALTNAKNGGWVHEVTRASESGDIYSTNNEIGTSEGRQVIHDGDATAEVLLVHGVAYIKGNAKGITDYFQLTTAHSGTLSGKWLTVTTADKNFATYTAAVTLESDFSAITLSGPYKEGTQTVVDHQKVIPVHGHVSGGTGNPQAAATLYVTATGEVLPIEFSAATKSVKETTVWSGWGQTVHLAAPVHSEPIPSG
jgi:hypothetical protein